MRFKMNWTMGEMMPEMAEAPEMGMMMRMRIKVP